MVINVLKEAKSYGYNDYNNSYSGCCYSQHAEMNLLKKPIRNFKKHKSIQMIVIRFNKLGELSNSKPCNKCLKYISKSNLNITHIYYSNDQGIIIKSTVKQLINSEQHYTYTFSKTYKKTKKNETLTVS